MTPQLHINASTILQQRSIYSDQKTMNVEGGQETNMQTITIQFYVYVPEV